MKIVLPKKLFIIILSLVALIVLGIIAYIIIFTEGDLVQYIGDNKDKANNYYERAVSDGENITQENREENFKKAIEYYEKVLGKEGDSVEILTKLGNSYYFAGDIENAKRIFMRLIEFDENAVEGYSGLGNIYRTEGDLEEAEEYFKLATEKDQDNEQIDTSNYVDLAHNLSQQGKYQEAIDLLNSVLGQNPNDANLMFLLPQLYRELGQEDKAQMIEEQLKTIAPELF